MDTQTKPAIPHGSVELKNKIWKLPIIPKIKHMLWRITSRVIPTRSRLTSRGMKIDPHCPRCPSEEETISHVLFNCNFAHLTWRLSNSPVLNGHQFSENSEENVAHIIGSYGNQNLTEAQKLLPFWLIWKLWKARNKLVFNNFRESPTRIVLQAQAEVEEWLHTLGSRSAILSETRQFQTQTSSWTKPPFFFVKCNFDASVDINSSRGTVGWIIRDHHGEAKAWGSSKLAHICSPLEAETKALLVAMQQAWIRGYKKIQFEGDCEILIKAITGISSHSEIANLLLDIDLWSSRFSSVFFTFVRRHCNSIAHCLASFTCNTTEFYSDSVNQPLWLRNMLCNDSS